MNTTLYQINTRVWLRRFDQPGKRATLLEVPTAFWDRLAERGIRMVWLMGVWQTVPAAIKDYDFAPHLVAGYTEEVPEWRAEDVIGSPYAIDRYLVSADLGGEAALARVREELHAREMRLILDFVPNHFHAASSLVEAHPDFFLQANEELLRQDTFSYYRAPHDRQLILAHGRDPYFPAWHDTVQVNHFNPLARRFMIDELVKIAGHCDGLRCDMAMLLLNDVFKPTWRHLLAGPPFPTTEFWQQAIDKVRATYPTFTFIAEVYWKKQAVLQRLGFDYTYEKEFLDLLKNEDVVAIKNHLHNPAGEPRAAVRFLENHDEGRILAAFNQKRAEAAAVIVATLPGMRFYHGGQWEGKRAKIPVQIGREPIEAHCQCAIAQDFGAEDEATLPGQAVNCICTHRFYEKLLALTKADIFYSGEWEIQEVYPLREGDKSHFNILAWHWRLGKEARLVVVNFHDGPASGVISLPNTDHLEIVELFSNEIITNVVQGQLRLRFYPYQYRIMAY